MSDLDSNTQAIHQIVARLDVRRKKLAVLFVGLALGLTAAGIAAFVAVKEPLVAGLAALGIYGFYYAINRNYRTRLSSQILPLMAEMAGGFVYDVDGKWVSDLQQAGFLPAGSAKRTEDKVTGHIGDVSFTSWEAEITRRSGKSERRVWQGLLVELTTRDHRRLLVRPARLRRGFRFSGLFGMTTPRDLIQTKSKVLFRDMAAFLVPGEWNLSALEGRLEEVARAVTPGLRLYGVWQRGGRVVIAIDATYDLFRLGGLFTPREALMREIDKAFSDLAIAPTAAVLWVQSPVPGRPN